MANLITLNSISFTYDTTDLYVYVHTDTNCVPEKTGNININFQIENYVIDPSELL